MEHKTFEEVKTDMMILGVYREEFDPIINIYLNILDQYDRAYAEFEKDGRMLIDCRSGQKKNPLLVTLEGLKKEIITYSDRLCLNPKSFDQVKNAKDIEEKTGLEKALELFNEKYNG